MAVVHEQIEITVRTINLNRQRTLPAQIHPKPVLVQPPEVIIHARDFDGLRLPPGIVLFEIVIRRRWRGLTRHKPPFDDVHVLTDKTGPVVEV